MSRTENTTGRFRGAIISVFGAFRGKKALQGAAETAAPAAKVVQVKEETKVATAEEMDMSMHGDCGCGCGGCGCGGEGCGGHS